MHAQVLRLPPTVIGNGALATMLRSEQASTVARSLTRVDVPLLVLAGEPAKRSEFSQAMTPPQLSTKTLSEISKAWAWSLSTRTSLPDSET